MAVLVYDIEHRTRYVHAGRVTTSQHVACLEPRALPYQRLLAHELRIEPDAASTSRRIDYFGNVLHQITMLRPYAELSVLSLGRVLVTPRLAPTATDEPVPWDEARTQLALDDTRADPAIVEFSYASPYVAISDALARFARPSFPPGRPLLAAALDLTRRIHREFTFLPNATTIATPVTRVLEDRHGVCQDFAHLQIGCLRSLGLAARYVSGYLLTDPPPGQARLVGADASHAWVAVWLPTSGEWLAIDPTNDQWVGDRYVTVAWGRDYGDVPPVKGVIFTEATKSTLKVSVDVAPV